MRRLILAVVVGLSLVALAAAPSPAQGAMTEADVQRIVRDYLKAHPEAVYEALQELQRRREAEEGARARAAIAEHRASLVANASDPVVNADGDVTLVEFFDYRCGYCRSMVPGLRELMARDKRLRVVFKEIPILSPESTMAAKAALAADRQGRYLDMHFALMAAKDLNRESLLATARSLGLDVARLGSDMDDPAIAAQIDANLKLAENLGITGTPAFVVGPELVPGAVEVGQLASLVAKERATSAN
jgi:protein-disulfide isomerase